jgi:hypothetical protein
MNKHERIEAAQAELHELKPAVEAARAVLAEHDELTREMKRARESYDVGDRVHVEKLCRRGCCTEDEFDGVVEGINSNRSYSVRTDQGQLRQYVSQYDMKPRGR